MTPLMLISTFVASYMCLVEGQSTCKTPNGAQGECISIDDCPPLYALVNKPQRTQQEVNLLRQSHCGYFGKKPQVCCPNKAQITNNDCATPDGQEGKCIGLYSCPYIVEMLATKPVSQDAFRFVQNSKCDGPEQYSVCCASKPLVPQSRPNGQCVLTAAPPDPRSECCGRESVQGNRIVGGNATSVDQYPWLSIIEYRGTDNRIKLLCGGSLISARYVLTAGHCVIGAVLSFGRPINVRLGEYDTSNDGEDCVPADGGGNDCTEGVTIIPIETTIPHPDYNPNSALRRNDIALVRLRRVAPYTDFIRPICLPQSDATLNPPNDMMLWAAGWGAVSTSESSSRIKLHVELPYTPYPVCQPVYNIAKRRIALWKGQMCAGGEKGKDSCKGDSGGPLMYETGGHYEVVGIVSFGPTPCGLEDVPGVYTKVYEYNTWIRGQIKP